MCCSRWRCPEAAGDDVLSSIGAGGHALNALDAGGQALNAVDAGGHALNAVGAGGCALWGGGRGRKVLEIVEDMHQGQKNPVRLQMYAKVSIFQSGECGVVGGF
jgi:hypothetical protein